MSPDFDNDNDDDDDDSNDDADGVVDDFGIAVDDGDVDDDNARGDFNNDESRSFAYVCAVFGQKLLREGLAPYFHCLGNHPTGYPTSISYSIDFSDV